MIDRLKEQIILHEGIRLKPYNDTKGKLTIGVGHNLTDNGIPFEISEKLLEGDLIIAVLDLKRALPWFEKLDEIRQRVLIDMCFNLGINGLLKFVKTLKSIEEGEYKFASLQMLQSLWAQQVGKRAIRLAEMMETG